jgi:hypothetical protein
VDINSYMALGKHVVLALGFEDCDDYEGFLADDGRVKKLASIGADVPPLELGVFAYSLVAWSKYGYSLFDVDESLLAGLLLTAPTDAPGFPHCPFPSFVIRIPEGFISFPDLARTSLTEPFSPESSSWLTLIHVSHVRNMPVKGGSYTSALKITGFIGGATSASMSNLILEGGFENAQKHLEADATWLWEGAQVTDSASDVSNKAMLRVVFNLLTWLESVGGITTQKQADHVLARMRRRSGKPLPRRWRLSSDIEISPEIVEAARQSGQGCEGGWHVTRRHVVRGHLRNQVCGKGRLERKVRWIAPHWKGPVAGDVLSHVYRVTEKLRKK